MEKRDGMDVALLKEIYVNKYMMFYLYAFTKTKNVGDAEDLVQDAFCTAVEKISSFSSSINPEGWIIQTLKNKIKNFNRKSATNLNVSLDESWANKIPYNTEFEIDKSIGLLECSHKVLSSQEYKILHFILFEGHTFFEASQFFQISICSCQKKYQRILKKIRPKAEALMGI